MWQLMTYSFYDRICCMNKEALRAGHEAKKVLLREVIRQKVWQIKPKRISVAQWSMQRKIGFQYTFTDKTYEELGAQYGNYAERILDN